MKIAIAIVMVIFAIGVILVYVRGRGTVAGVETIQEVGDTDFSQLDSTVSGL